VRQGLAVILMGGFVLALAAPVAAKDQPAETTGPSSEALAIVAEAQMRLSVGAIAEGLKLFRRAVALDPENLALAEEFGLALADAGINDEAVKQLERAGDLTPTGEATLGMLLAQVAQTPQELEAALPHLERGVAAVPHGGQARLVLAQSLVRLGKGAEAWEQVKVLLDDQPDDPRIWLMAGETLRLTGKFTEAAGYLKRAAAVPELRQRATLELVDTLASAGKYKEAADILGDVLKKEGGTLAGMTRWATLLARAGDRVHAREVLDKVLAGDPNQRDAILLKAILEAGDGHLDVAEGLYRRAHAAYPDDPDAAMGLARLLVDMRRLPEARTLLNSVWQQIEEKKIDNPDATVEVAQERAALELLDHRPDAALPWIEKCGGGTMARRTLALWGEYYRLREAWRDGLTFLRGAKVEDDPDAVRLKSALFAEFSLAAGDEAAAAPVLDTLLAGNEDDVVAALGVLDRAKRFADAAARARVAAARLGDAPAVQFAYAAALERSGAWDDAVTQFKKLLAKQSDNAAALNYLGYMFADKGVHLEEARGMLTKAVQLDPSSGAFQDSLGWVYFRLGDLDRAEKYLTEASRLDPFDASVKEHVGDLLRARGDMSRAAEAYRQALANIPEEAGQKERIEKKLAEVAGGKTP